MATRTVDVHESEVHLEDLVGLALNGTEVLIAEGPKPVARLVPIHRTNGTRVPGLHPDSVWISDDFDDPLPDEFWMGSK